MDHTDVEWFVRVLDGEAGWVTAAEVLRRVGKPTGEAEKRWLRALADRSEGRVCGGSRGYRLTGKLTHDEYHQWRNTWLSSKDAITARILRTDHHFYSRQPTQ